MAKTPGDAKLGAALKASLRAVTPPRTVARLWAAVRDPYQL